MLPLWPHRAIAVLRHSLGIHTRELPPLVSAKHGSLYPLAIEPLPPPRAFVSPSLHTSYPSCPIQSQTPAAFCHPLSGSVAFASHDAGQTRASEGRRSGLTESSVASVAVLAVRRQSDAPHTLHSAELLPVAKQRRYHSLHHTPIFIHSRLSLPQQHDLRNSEQREKGRDNSVVGVGTGTCLRSMSIAFFPASRVAYHRHRRDLGMGFVSRKAQVYARIRHDFPHNSQLSRQREN